MNTKANTLACRFWAWVERITAAQLVTVIAALVFLWVILAITKPPGVVE